VKASEEQIAQSSGRHWQEDLLFVLKQEHEGYEFCQKQMDRVRYAAQAVSPAARDRSQGAPLPEEKRKGRLKKRRGNAPQFGLARRGCFAWPVRT